MKQMFDLSGLSARTAVWAAQNPVAARVAMLALPALLAVVTAALTNTPVFADPPGSSGCGCTGG
jgi:hypothetical protein